MPVGGEHTGNYGFVMLLHLVVNDLNSSFLLENSSRISAVLRFLILSATVLCVFLAKKKNIEVALSALLLAHFLTYQHVWEHHISGVILIGVFLLTGEGLKKIDIILLLICVISLALPTPYVFFDKTKDPEELNPAFWWPGYASYVVLLPKVAPTALMFGWCIGKLLKQEETLTSPSPAQEQA
jgi:hypothetical protein